MDKESVFEIKDNYTVQGISEDYVWYESKLLITQMQGWQNHFERVVNVMENRHKEHLKIIDTLLAEIKDLKRKQHEDRNTSIHSNTMDGV